MISDEETNSFETEENRNTFKLNHPEESIEEPSPEFEAHHNLIGLFSILLEVDRRINPENYKRPGHAAQAKHELLKLTK
ncbi:hypothetical protein A2911_00130 [Candidatus Nomurabacteria bacterium RIFCSPLOWO2_01_FULL_40_15]|uniref:Uncharacterized protein n=1 Tax=Candidatus Nomurabacteria bacterium RIFCSPLOWO2_01_FULL_40_15 TaxID=1801772 RepID=A0A1F6X899_9BACT|nr:MAG: hypothetical protein A2911_00130 [Candidatus Nomurabacteria bacterium RIFCSPLOWO2_01_FULL_40_15]